MVEVIKFELPNCGPCKILQVMMDKLAEEFKDKPVKFTRVNIFGNFDLADKYAVMTAPTVIIVCGDKVKGFAGAKFRLSDYSEAIQSFLG